MLTFTRPISDVRSFTLRVSPRYLSPANDPLVDQLRKLPTARLRDACIVPLHRGVQPPKAADESDDDTALAIGVTELKNGHIDYDSARRIPFVFYSENSHAAGIRLGDLLIASTGATIGKVDAFDNQEAAIANNHTTIVRVDAKRFNPVFLLAYLRSRLFQFQIQRDWSGSAQPEIYPDELAVMRIAAISKAKQDQLTSRISALDAQIADARAKVKSPADIINKILCKAFRYPMTGHRERQFPKNFSHFTDSYSLRGSVKFHHPDYELTDAFFASTPHKRVKDFLAVPIRLGVSLTQEVMDDDSEAYYVHPSAVRHQERIETADCHRITMEYYEQNKRRGSLRPGDVVINRSGEALGKVAFFDNNQPCLASDFTMRVRFADSMNPTFAWYYFRSVIFQSQIEREARGMSLPNIFPSQVETLLVPACRRDRQNTLADQITAALAVRQNELQTIESRRQEIAALIESALSR